MRDACGFLAAEKDSTTGVWLGNDGRDRCVWGGRGGARKRLADGAVSASATTVEDTTDTAHISTPKRMTALILHAFLSISVTFTNSEAGRLPDYYVTLAPGNEGFYLSYGTIARDC